MRGGSSSSRERAVVGGRRSAARGSGVGEKVAGVGGNAFTRRQRSTSTHTDGRMARMDGWSDSAQEGVPRMFEAPPSMTATIPGVPHLAKVSREMSALHAERSSEQRARPRQPCESDRGDHWTKQGSSEAWGR